MDGWTEKRALQNRDDEDAEWSWSGQMCSNVFWPDPCKDAQTHTQTHTRAHAAAAQPMFYLLFMIPAGR